MGLGVGNGHDVQRLPEDLLFSVMRKLSSFPDSKEGGAWKGDLTRVGRFEIVTSENGRALSREMTRYCCWKPRIFLEWQTPVQFQA